jgi:hypothetical protein
LEDQIMGQPTGVCFDPETIEMLQTVLDEAWDALPPSRQQTVQKTELAERILAAAGLGERDPERLRALALMRPMQTATANQAASILRSSLARNA